MNAIVTHPAQSTSLFRHLLSFFLLCAASNTYGVTDATTKHVAPVDNGAFSPRYFGMHIHQPNISDNWPSIYFSSWRLWDIKTTWADIQPNKGEWHFSDLDAYVARANASNIEVLLVLGQTPNWAASKPFEPAAYGQGQASPPADSNNWRIYVRELAQRYKGKIRSYQLWNEVDQKSFWTGSIEQLVELSRIAKEEIAKADPDAKLVSPSFVGLDGRLNRALDFLDKGGNKYVDVLSYHLYHTGGTPESMLKPLLAWRAEIARRGYSAMPLWNTETGYFMSNWPPYPGESWSTDLLKIRISPAEAETFAPRAMLLSRALGFERFYWYAWDNKKMGMIEPATHVIRPYGQTIGKTFSLLYNSQLSSCDLDSTLLWSCRLTLANGKTASAHWADPSAQTPPSLLVKTPSVIKYFSERENISVKAGSVLPLDGNVILLIPDK